nr:response regulator [uncultured Holophaga sp.]
MARVAVLDDNQSARVFASACLRQAGYEVLELEPKCLYEVLKALHETPVDLMVTDLIMPDCPGLTLMQVCREDSHLKHLKILLLTAFGDEALGRFIRTHADIHYLGKPVTPQELTDAARLFLEGELEVDPGWALGCQGTVAIIDDSQMARLLHKNIVTKQGFRPVIIPPDNLTNAVAALQQAKPDAVILDFLMPGFRGDALIRALRASQNPQLQALPIVMVTAHDPSELLLREEGVEVLQKPTPAKLLVSTLQRVITRKG